MVNLSAPRRFYHPCDRTFGHPAAQGRFKASQSLFLANREEGAVRALFRSAAQRICEVLRWPSIPADAAPSQLRAHAEAWSLADAAAVRTLRSVWGLGRDASARITALGVSPWTNRARLRDALLCVFRPKATLSASSEAVFDRFLDSLAMLMDTTPTDFHGPAVTLNELLEAARAPAPSARRSATIPPTAAAS